MEDGINDDAAVVADGSATEDTTMVKPVVTDEASTEETTEEAAPEAEVVA